jgi:putative transposase
VKRLVNTDTQPALKARYSAFSVSANALEGVKRYIANQKEHHRRVDFKTEYVDLLNRAGIEFDEKFLW